MVAWVVYVVRCRDGSHYTGIAKDLAVRLAAHEAGRGARYTRGRGPLELVHVEPSPSRAAAQRREAEIKRLRAADKRRLGVQACAKPRP
jgi:putative endonuclease